ncbi:hypothetical protein [Gorillibacterium sp. sgz5001074]|uniref:hypothetical protein n=1 Tax=Gorillibacterium sp. sgz5001074 TaxID=3446695 RepID=UPI003F67F2E0
MDCDHNAQACGIAPGELKSILQSTLEEETELLRTYTILAERVHGNNELKTRLQNFAEGNAKRSRQLADELAQLE